MSETEKLISDSYREYSGAPAEKMQKLKGDASERQIYRLRSAESSIIAVYGPNLAENRAFIGFTRTFRKLKLPAPELLYVHPAEKIYFLEDLGDTTLFKKLTQQRNASDSFPEDSVLPYYEEAVDNLVRFQLEAADAIDYALCYQTAKFDAEAWEKDQRYFIYNFIAFMLPGYSNFEGLVNDLKSHCEILENHPQNQFLYRDFQSRNIMVTEAGLRFLDYQAGRRGAVSYDIASLLYDAKADLPDNFRQKLLEMHIKSITVKTGISEKTLREAFYPYALLRILQALGSYGNNGIRKGRTQYLESIPYALQNAISVIEKDNRLNRLRILKDTIELIQTEQLWLKYIINPVI